MRPLWAFQLWKVRQPDSSGQNEWLISLPWHDEEDTVPLAFPPGRQRRDVQTETILKTASNRCLDTTWPISYFQAYATPPPPLQKTQITQRSVGTWLLLKYVVDLILYGVRRCCGTAGYRWVPSGGGSYRPAFGAPTIIFYMFRRRMRRGRSCEEVREGGWVWTWKRNSLCVFMGKPVWTSADCPLTDQGPHG